MSRISLYADVDNLKEIFDMDRESKEFFYMKHFISIESNITLCETQEIAEQNSLFLNISNELTSGDFNFDYRSEHEKFLDPPFKTNLHHHFKDKRTILFSYDCDQVKKAKPKTGILLAGLGEEVEVYQKLNFNKEFFRGNKILTIEKTFNSYEDFKPYILPFFELIINEPYLFKPDRKEWDLENYINNNFKPLMKILLSNINNKVNIIINTFVNDQDEVKLKFPYYENDLQKENGKGFQPLYSMCKDFLNNLIGADRYKLWLTISPKARTARHDRYILTNYQYVESGAGLTYFDDRGDFSNRGEAIHLYSIMHDDARKELIPSVLNNLQDKVVTRILDSDPDRVFGPVDKDDKLENSYFLKFQ